MRTIAALGIVLAVIFILLGFFAILSWSAVGSLVAGSIGVVTIVFALLRMEAMKNASEREHKLISAEATAPLLVSGMKIKRIKKEEITITIHLLSLGQKWDIQVPWDIRTSDVAGYLSRRIGLGTRIGKLLAHNARIRLTMKDIVLDNEKTLRENGVGPGDTLYLLWSLAPSG